ncbi:MAG: PHP domain-containing protein [Kiritimatiellae bacterium]|nr:PHP domain-containing protein [Kiritimatiellia bacterium]
MSPAINWRNPYAAGGRFWLKGNLHTHTTCSDGRLSPEEVIRIYERMGYGFLSITDHGRVSSGNGVATELALLPGAELGPRHMCVIGLDPARIANRAGDSSQQRITRNVKRRNIVILNHPDWQAREHYTIDELKALSGYTGIEIYNSVIERLAGSPLSTAKWDRLLGSGMRVLGFATQDAHRAGDHLDCCCVVRVNRSSRAAVFNALARGNFYCYYGVAITDIGRRRDRVFVATENATLIRFVGKDGKILAKTRGQSAEYTFGKGTDTDYVRIECLGTGEEISWSQPFFRAAV